MKHLSVLSAFVLAAALCVFPSCSKELPAEGKFLVTASFYPLYIMLLNIMEGADNVELSLLAPADTGCLHDYQLTTRDRKMIDSASVLVVNGAGMEDFIGKITELKGDAVITASDGYPLTDGNPHIWVSPAGAVHEVTAIAEGLALFDPANAELYRSNARAYIDDIKSLSDKMHASLDGYAGASIITFHEAFPYFAEEFGLTVTGVVEREPGALPSPKELAKLIDYIALIRDEKGAPPVLFAETDYPSASAEVIARETGCPIYELNPAVTGPLEKDAYLNAMRDNLRVLEKALGGDQPAGGY